MKRTIELSAEATNFLPGSSTHKLIFKRRVLNPLASPFRPILGRDMLPVPLVPLDHHKSVTGAYTKSSLNVHAASFVPARMREWSDAKHLSQSQESTQQGPKPPDRICYYRPESITKTYAEAGQLRRVHKPLYFRPAPSSFPTPEDHPARFTPAKNIAYKGSVENQRQIFIVQQSSEREISYNWKGNALSAGGEEMSGDEAGSWSEDMIHAEAIAQPPPVHHINWMGRPVPYKSDTPPAVSLVIIMSLLKPRGLSFGNHPKSLYQAALFNNAFNTIDPVCYLGDDVDALFNERGTALQELVTGEVIKLYTEQGFWHNTYFEQHNDDDDTPGLDTLDEAQYRLEHTILNGWFENHGLPTFRDFVELDTSANIRNKLQRCLSVIKRFPFHCTKSRLNQVMYQQEVVDEGALEPSSSVYPLACIAPPGYSAEIDADITHDTSVLTTKLEDECGNSFKYTSLLLAGDDNDPNEERSSQGSTVSASIDLTDVSSSALETLSNQSHNAISTRNTTVISSHDSPDIRELDANSCISSAAGNIVEDLAGVGTSLNYAAEDRLSRSHVEGLDADANVSSPPIDGRVFPNASVMSLTDQLSISEKHHRLSAEVANVSRGAEPKEVEPSDGADVYEFQIFDDIKDAQPVDLLDVRKSRHASQRKASFANSIEKCCAAPSRMNGLCLTKSSGLMKRSPDQNLAHGFQIPNSDLALPTFRTIESRSQGFSSDTSVLKRSPGPSVQATISSSNPSKAPHRSVYQQMVHKIKRALKVFKREMNVLH